MSFIADFTEEALGDLADLWTYYARVFDEKLAQRRVDEVLIRVQEICTFPESGALHRGRKPDVRKISVRQYLIFYRVSQGRVLILRVLNARRGDLELEV